ncbi:MAG: hypothetical protein ABFS42_13020 [Candidatus Krumholzibacteriota bacterium]
MNTRLGKKYYVLPILGLLIGILSVAEAKGAVDVNLGAEIQIDDDTEVFIGVSSRYYDRDPDHVRGWHRQCKNPDDLAVTMFLARHSGKSPAYLLTLRKEGVSWWEISVGLGVEPDVWFLPVRIEPGPPYGKAYGHWKKSKKSKQRFVLNDTDCRNLVAARMLHECYGVSVDRAMEMRASGKNLKKLTAQEYRNKHGKNHKKDKKVAQNSSKGNSKGKGKGKGKGKK